MCGHLIKILDLFANLLQSFQTCEKCGDQISNICTWSICVFECKVMLHVFTGLNNCAALFLITMLVCLTFTEAHKHLYIYTMYCRAGTSSIAV